MRHGVPGEFGSGSTTSAVVMGESRLEGERWWCVLHALALDKPFNIIGVLVFVVLRVVVQCFTLR